MAKESEFKANYIMVDQDKYEDLLLCKGKQESYKEILQCVIHSLADSYFKK